MVVFFIQFMHCFYSCTSNIFCNCLYYVQLSVHSQLAFYMFNSLFNNFISGLYSTNTVKTAGLINSDADMETSILHCSYNGDSLQSQIAEVNINKVPSQ